jgi:hypothetical protein
MLDTSKRTSHWIAALAIMAVSACSMVMNATFGYSLGSTDLEKWTFVVAGVGLDFFKVFGLGFVAMAFYKKYYVKGSAAFICWITCVVYSLVAATGFAATTRSNVTSERTFEVGKITKVNTEYETQKSELNTLLEEMATMKNNVRYLSTAGCSVPEARMKTESRYFCTQFQTKQDNINEKRTAVFVAKEKVPANEFVKDPDPQMTFYSSLFNIPVAALISYWAIGLAIVFELVSSLGMYSISSSRMKHVYLAKNNGQIKSVQYTENEDGLMEATMVKRRGRPKGSKNKPKNSMAA